MPLGFFSAAEVFLVLSGFVAFIVYFRYSGENCQLTKIIWKRAGIIYLFHVLGAFTVFLLITIFPVFNEIWIESYGIENFISDPIWSLIRVCLLLEYPAYHDILVLYLLPMTTLPLAIGLIALGRAHYVALVSFGVWLVSQYVDSHGLLSFIADMSSQYRPTLMHIDPFSWQIYFYMGVLASAYRTTLAEVLLTKSVMTVVYFAAFALLLTRHIYGPWQSIESYFWLAGDLSTAPILTMANVALWMIIFSKLSQKRTLFISKFPIFIGQHALPVFAFHSVVLFFIAPFFDSYVTKYWWADLAACVSFVAALYLPAKVDQLYRTNVRKASKDAKQFASTI